MKPAWRKYLSARAPRYTSYPSALYFDESVDEAVYRRTLAQIGLYEPVSLYVHIPFCRQLCWYCGCNMRVENDYRRAVSYVERLCAEIELVASALGGRGRPVTVHFGGGSPNFLDNAELSRILDAIESNFGLTDDARLAIEIDPRLVKQDDIAALARLGFTRLSLGVQDFDPAVQRAINRVQNFDLVEACVGAAREAGVEDLSFDLLYGLPRQTLTSFAETLVKTVALAPDRVSVFGYAHLPAALPRQRMIDRADLPKDDLRAELSSLAYQMLTAAGYGAVGFDHYAKPGNPLFAAACAGTLRRNFQGFTDDAARTTIGLGASAVGFVKGVYAQNAKSVKQYVARLDEGRLPTEKGVVRSRRDDAYARLIEDLLCRGRSDLTSLRSVLDEAGIDNIKQSIRQFIKDDMVSLEGDVIKVAPEARELSRVIAAAVDPYVGETPAFAKVV